jgi:hypothetical protein
MPIVVAIVLYYECQETSLTILHLLEADSDILTRLCVKAVFGVPPDSCRCRRMEVEVSRGHILSFIEKHRVEKATVCKLSVRTSL